MKVTLRIALVLCFISLFWTCKKYPENDHIYLGSIKKRLDTHDWYFSRLLIDGNDSTIVHLNHYTTSYSTEPRDLHFKIKEFAFNSDGSTLVFYIPIITSGPYPIQLSLRSRKEKAYLDTHINPGGTFKDFFFESQIDWEIKKLTKTEFIIEKTLNNIKYRFEFKE